MGLVRLAVPAALLLWFLWKARTNRLCLLGIPVLMVMGQSVFFDKMKIFWKPGRLDATTLTMAWLFVVWLFTAIRPASDPLGVNVGPLGPSRILPEELPLLLLVALMAVHTLGLFSTTGDLAGAVSTAFPAFCLVLGYLLLRGIASHATRAETLEFLEMVVLANTAAAALFFIHQGLHVSIYNYGEYLSTTFAGQRITRTFTFAPQYSLLALGFVLGRRKWTPKLIAVLVVTMLAILVSYTRSLLIAAVIALVLAIVVQEVSRPDVSRFVRRSVAILASAFGAFAIFALARPVDYRFLLSRLSEFTSGKGKSDIGTWQIRMHHFAIVEKVVARSDLWFGLGYKPSPSISTFNFNAWTSDMAWVPILYYFGVIGLALVGVVFGGFLARTVWLSRQPPEEGRYFGRMFTITIALTIVVSFTSWSFMEPRIYPMGLLILAFAAVETLRRREDTSALAAERV